MEKKDVSYIMRFLGVVEGVSETLPKGAQSMVYDYIAVIDGILDKELESENK
jgi:hypothetical protein